MVRVLSWISCTLARCRRQWIHRDHWQVMELLPRQKKTARWPFFQHSIPS